MILNVMRAIVDAIERGQTGVVATVLDHKGSSPGKRTQTMLVLADGTRTGTVGGGRLEALVLEAVPTVLASGRGTCLDLLIAEEGDGATGQVCGGRAIVAIEMLPRVPRLLICGGGHCAREVARLLEQVGYAYEVHEDREDWLGERHFSGAAALHHGTIDAFVSDVGPLDRFYGVLLISRGRETDRQYGRVLAEADYSGWVGMLASKRKARCVREQWRSEDGIDAEFVVRVESPVGLPIPTRNPAEIAVSIVGRIIALTNGSPS